MLVLLYPQVLSATPKKPLHSFGTFCGRFAYLAAQLCQSLCRSVVGCPTNRPASKWERKEAFQDDVASGQLFPDDLRPQEKALRSSRMDCQPNRYSAMPTETPKANQRPS